MVPLATMMHIMQPVVMDTGWPTIHSSAAVSCPPLSAVNAGTALAEDRRTTVTASLSNPDAVNQPSVVDIESDPVSAISFKTRRDVSPAQRTSSRSSTITPSNVNVPAENPPKPPKKPLAPYMRFSKAVS